MGNPHPPRAVKVSVVVPAYNIAGYLTATLRSLTTQTYDNFEVLIVDDGSTDKTAQVAHAFAANYENFHLLRKPNGGLSSARNFGIAAAKGEYIALLDGDDLYRPEKLARHVAILDRKPEIGLVYSASQALRDDGGRTWFYLSGKPVAEDPLEALLYKNFVGHGSNAMFRRSLVAQVGGFDERLVSVEDLDFWLRIAETGEWEFYRDRRVLCDYRVRPAGLSYNTQQMQKTHELVIGRVADRHPERTAKIMPRAYAYMYRYLARLAMTTGDGDRAKTYLDRAWQSDSSIFWRDGRSMTTLLSVKCAPLAKQLIAQSLGSTAALAKK
ncbi:MAG: glycosyltransferase family 2 protein [Alkalinema sp. RU_4_3]|nr:glycosyltransferase family 2 protein [Alkalinema sp. RU_4_3]